MRLLVAILIAAIASPLLAQNTSALINEQLDKIVALTLDKTLPAALQQIAADTSVPITADPSVYELLPWGEQTKITATIKNQTLRGALQAITRKLGLTFDLGDESVILRPLPALKRLGRRATVEELGVLDLLASTPLEPQGDSMTVKQLLAAVDTKLEAAKNPFAVENRAFNDDHSPPIGVARNATLLDALEAIPQKSDATWYPWGKTIVVVPKTDQVRTQLAKTITIRFNGVDVGQVLSELQTRSGVDFIIEPGAVQRISPDSRNVRLMLSNASIQQALESIMGFTGLAYTVNDKGVYIWNPSNTQGAVGGREPMIGLMTLDNGMQVLVPVSQVPPELREYLKTKTEKQLAKIREQMKEEGFKPATKPATPPSSQKSDDL